MRPLDRHYQQDLGGWPAFIWTGSTDVVDPDVQATPSGHECQEKSFTDTGFTAEEGQSGLVYLSDVKLSNLNDAGVLVPAPAQVKAYLLDHPDMIGLTEQICLALLERFPKPSNVVLEVYEDPEMDDRHLTVYVRQPDYDDAILEILEQVSSQFQAELGASSGWVHITTDFEPPVDAESVRLERLS